MREHKDDIEILVREAGARLQPTTDLTHSVRRESYHAWQAAVTQQKYNRWKQLGMSLAAGLLLTSTFLFYQNDDGTFGVNLIAAKHILVDNELHKPGALRLLPGNNMLAAEPARIITEAGVELRLGAATNINWLTPDTVYLTSGTIYIDTHDKSTFNVKTSLGVIRDIGTRYLVSANSNGVELAVREGEAIAIVESNGKSVHVSGNGVNAQVVRLNGTDLKISNESAAHNRWEWIHELTPNYPDVSVQKLLEAICADLGKQLIFESPGVETSTINQRVTSGSLQGLHPAKALKVLVEISGLQMSENSREVRITF